MKRLISIWIILIIGSQLSAQEYVTKGTYTVGGNFSYSSESEDDYDAENSLLFLAPSIGYFFIDNFYTGLRISYIYSSSGNSSSDNFGIGPTIRYYITKNQLKPFVGLSYDFSKSVDSDDFESEFTTFTSTAGLAYFVTNYFALEGSVNYSINNHNISTTTNDFSTGSKTFRILVGANYYIM